MRGLQLQSVMVSVLAGASHAGLDVFLLAPTAFRLGCCSTLCPQTPCHSPASSHPADGMPCYTAAEEVVLVELASGQVQHAPTARVVLEQIAPQAKLTVLQAEWAPEAAADGAPAS